MAFDIRSTLQNMQSKLAASGYFHGASVLVGEPKAPPSAGGLSVAMWMSSAKVVSTTLAAPIENHTVIVRIYSDLFQEPQEDREWTLAQAASDFMSDLCGDFDLGTTIRAVDVGGQYSGGLP